MRAGICGGKTLSDLKATDLPEKFKSFGTGFINTESWITTIYNSTTKK